MIGKALPRYFGFNRKLTEYKLNWKHPISDWPFWPLCGQMMKYTCDVQSKQIECYLQPISDEQDKIFYFYRLKYGQTCSHCLASSPSLTARGMQGCNGSIFCDFCGETTN